MVVMPPVTDTDSNPGTRGQVANSAQMFGTAGSPHQVSAVDSSAVGWHQMNRPWGNQHEWGGCSSRMNPAEEMNSSKILSFFCFLESLDVQALQEVPM